MEPESGRFAPSLLPQMSQLTALYPTQTAVGPECAWRQPQGGAAAPDQDLRGVTVWRDSLRVPDAGDAAAEWLSAFIGRPCRLVQVPEARPPGRHWLRPAG